MKFFDLLGPFLLSSAGVTAIVSVITGVVKWRIGRQPRQRVAAIRAGTETLALLESGSAAHNAVSDQIEAETQALTASLTRKPAKLARFLSPVVGIAVSLVGATLGIALSIIPAGEDWPSGSEDTSTAFAVFLGWAIPLLAVTSAGIVGLVLKRPRKR